MSDLPPRAEVIDALLHAVLPAVVASAGVFGGLALVLSRLSPHWRRAMPAVAVLALTAAVAAGNVYRGAFPWWPDGRWWHWAGPALVLAFAVELVARVRGVSDGTGVVLRGLAAGAVGLAVVPPDERAGYRPVVEVALTVAALWYPLTLAGRAGGSLLVTAGMAVATLTGSAVLLHHKSIGFSDVLTVVGVALGVLAVLGRLTRTDPSAAGAVAVVPLVALLALGRALADSDIPRGVFLLAGGLPLVLVARAWPAAGGRVGVATVAALVLLGAGAAVGLTMHHAPLRFGDEW